MGYLTDDDYLTLISEDNFREVVGPNPIARIDAEAATEEEIYSYLGNSYDVATEFKKTGDARNKKLVLVFIDIALYHLHSRINPRNIPDLRKERYDGNGQSPVPESSAIGWLTAVNSDRLVTNLNRIPNDLGNTIKYVGDDPVDLQL